MSLDEINNVTGDGWGFNAEMINDRIGLRRGGTTFGFTTTNPNDGDWHRLVWVREGTGSNLFRVYEDMSANDCELRRWFRSLFERSRSGSSKCPSRTVLVVCRNGLSVGWRGARKRIDRSVG